MKFAIQKGYEGREASAIILTAHKLSMAFYITEHPNPNDIPIGTVEFCTPSFGPHRVDFFPAFLSKYLTRPQATITSVNSATLDHPAFIKDLSAWKTDWESKVYSAGTLRPPGTWKMAKPVTFQNEWRCYVAAGTVFTIEWYRGVDEDAQMPDIDVKWPKGFSGAVDFGTIEGHQNPELIECHSPFACGWYGESENHAHYALWQQAAWANREWWRI